MIGLKVFGQIQYSDGCIQETFVFEVSELFGELNHWLLLQRQRDRP